MYPIVDRVNRCLLTQHPHFVGRFFSISPLSLIQQQRNRFEWEDRGRALVAEYVQDFQEQKAKKYKKQQQEYPGGIKREHAPRTRFVNEEEEKQQEE